MISLQELIQKRKTTHGSKGTYSAFGFFHKYLAASLIFLLFLSQTIHVSLFDTAEASIADYRDIVSIIVDQDTYDVLRPKITRYASDIQGYLKATRVSLFVTPRDARPEVIAAHNEKLYYEGDDKGGISTLVGTILIGDIPIPVVKKEGTSFPSLYPYVDFDEKRFVYDAPQKTYIFSKNTSQSSDVDIWHGVINPSIGVAWQNSVDIPKVGAFLDKTHDFYTRSGKFVPSLLPPRVYYYDGYNESASVDMISLYKYVLTTANSENLVYKRWSKYLLGDISTALSQFNAANKGPEDAYAATIPGLEGVNIGDESIDPTTLKTLPDIQTARPIMAYLKKFYEIINKKTLSDIQKSVHNAGRYNNGGSVRVDQGAVSMTMTDEIALAKIKTINDTLEKSIDTSITSNNYAKRILILDGIWKKSPLLTSTPTQIEYATWASNPLIEYKNYYFGRQASTITDPSQCSIARGSSGTTSSFGRSIITESNAGYDVNTTEGHVGYLSGDTTELVGIWRNPAYACFTPAGVPKIESYFGRNSLLRIAGTPTDPSTLFTDLPSGMSMTGFSLPIFSSGGMKETGRFPDPSIDDCIRPDFQYTLLEPHTYDYTYSYLVGDGDMLGTCTGAYPDEWSRSNGYCPKSALTSTPRFTCLTEHRSLSEGTSISDALAKYSSSCYYGTLRIDGKYFNNTPALSSAPVSLGNQCIITQGSLENGLTTTDTTIYHDQTYHTIPSLLRHVSPTDDELTAAEANGATPSLPIDIVRSVEFLTPKGARAKLTYPNFFAAPTTSIADVRAWLKNISDTEWGAIIARENTISLTPSDTTVNAALGAGNLPPTPVDWNTLISDEVIREVIQSRRWLTPKVTEKYKKLVETDLSYSHISGGDPLSERPISTTHTGGYEIAYLGLAPFVPGGEKDPNNEDVQAYQYRLGEIQGLNFSERDSALDDPASRATAQCGPPDGVPLFQWPSAIICWIKSLVPPRITAGSCGGNSIGISKPSMTTTTPPATIARDSQKLREYYTQGKLVYSVPRTSLGLQSSLDVTYMLDRGGERVILPSSSTLSLDIVSIQSGSISIPRSRYGEYFSISSPETSYTDQGVKLLVSSYDQLARVTLRPTLRITLPDASEMQIVGDPLILSITDTYLELTPTIDTRPVATVDTTSGSPVDITIMPKRGASSDILSLLLPYQIEIYDDVDGTLIASGITSPASPYRFPSRYQSKIGVYRISVTDADGRAGEATLAVRSGPVARIEFAPVSSTLAKGATSLGTLRLLDANGNPISPTLLSLRVSTDVGYLLDPSGDRVSSLSLDTIEPELLLSYGTDTSGDMRLEFQIQDPALSVSQTIRVIDTPRIQIVRPVSPQVGGDPITMQIRVLDGATGDPLRGFSSVAFLDIPEGAGKFSTTELPLTDGESAPFIFTPGKKSGDHVLSIDIPGIGSTREKKFNILTGVPMYVDGTITDTSIDFSLRDRYGNLSDQSLPGTLKKNQDAPANLNFTAGTLSFPRSSGYWRIDVPGIEANTLTYTDIENTQTPTGVTTTPVTKVIKGISYYNLYVADTVGKYGFLPDYNARYTVLAGDSYLKEGGQILYDTTPGASQSLAVSTLLSSPYSKDILFSIFPGGGYSLGEPSDMALESTISARGDTLRLDITDKASQTPIAQVAYPMTGLPFTSCTESGTDTQTCTLPTQAGGVTLALFPESEYRIEGRADALSIVENTIPLITYSKTSGLSLAPGTRLIPRPEYSYGHMVADIESGSDVIGRILVGLPEAQGVDIARINTTPLKLTLDPSHAYSRMDVYANNFSPASRGYAIYRPGDTITLDERVIGPNHIASIGSLRESPGVGWQGNNRSLLSFAAGDTVGEANRWFQSYTLVNLGDPVAHVDRGAPGTELDGIDRTIGTQIAGSSQRSIASYKQRDMNADRLEDLIVIYDDGFMELYLNMGGVFRRKQMIAYLPDITTRGVDFGDFTGDKYADIISLDRSGSFVLVDNTSRRLTEKLITLSDGSPLPQKITQYKIYDMDADGRDDIVYLTEAGELGVLYGGAVAGTFTRVILDRSLGVSLSGDPERSGGAVRASVIPTSLPPISASTTGPDTRVLQGEVYYPRRVNATPVSSSVPLDLSRSEASLLSSFQDPNSTSQVVPDLYVRSEYAPAYGLEIERRFQNITSSTLHRGDRIQVDITLKNTTPNTIRNIEYLDTLPKIFDLPRDAQYSVTLGGSRSQYPLMTLAGEEYDLSLKGVDIPSGQVLTISYELEALPVAYGTMIVDKLEGGLLVGDDIYGDVGFETSNTCGADMLLWSSTGVRSYLRGTRTFTPAELPPSLASRLADRDNNGTPDSIQNMSPADLKTAYKDLGNQSSLSQSPLLSARVDTSGNIASIGFSPQAEQQIETIAKNLADGLSCGFGGGGCMSFPINWAPNAPGNSLSILGEPIITPSINQGVPIFSALTCMPLSVPKPCGTSLCPATMGIPMTFPISPLRYEKSSWQYGFPNYAACGTSGDLGAGGSLGTDSTKNIVRIFVTPTLTLGVGGAVCLGPARGGRNPLYPLIPYGNCIVMTKSLPVCKGDGSSTDGSVSGISGLGSTTDAWNGKSCTMKAQTTSRAENTTMIQDVIGYLRSPDTTRLNAVYTSISRRGGRGVDMGGPVARIGDGVTSGTTIDIGLDSMKPLSVDNIIKVNNRRISGFPEFIMDWVTRQTDEFTNKFLTLPSIVIIPPRSFGQNAVVDGSYADFGDRFSKDRLEQGWKDLKTQVGEAGNVEVTKAFNKRTDGRANIPPGTGLATSAISGVNDKKKSYDAWLDTKVSENASTINSAAGGVNQIKAVYQFLGQLPLIRIEQASVAINVPWILPQELDRYARSLTQYQNELDRAKKGWCDGNPLSKACIDSKTNVGLGGLSSGIQAGIKSIEEWRRFPEKIQKYITWKQRYITQVLCNVDAVEQMLNGWYRDNGVRFKKWAEFYVLMKTIVATWQPFLDIWREKDRTCAVCQNQRWDLKYWKFKLLSAVIPSFPILQFPRWPDIIFDLSDIRLGILIRVPDFRFNITPIRLPDLPSFGLPGLPSLSLNLPGLPRIPSPPNLPDLPDLPSLPRISLPNLPPPPKLPKLFGAVSVAINIFKLLVKIQCYMEKTVLIPEDYVGATIAQRTDRQGTLPFDFLNLQFPQIAIPGIKEIRVSTHVNFELKSDFIVEFARNAVKPINRLNTDFAKIPTKIAPDLNISSPPNIPIRINGMVDPTRESKTAYIEEIEKDIESLASSSGEMMDIDTFAPYLRKQLILAGLDARGLDRSMVKARTESDAFTQKMQKESDRGFTLIRQYLDAETAKTHELEKMLDRMQDPSSLLADRDIPLAQFVSERSDISDRALEKYTSWQKGQASSLLTSTNISPSSDPQIESIRGQLGRMIALEPTPSAQPTGVGPTAAGYSPKYEGIFILTPVTKTQTRLFDYSDLLTSDDTADVTDIDRDGDQDYIFLLGGSLYVKYSHLSDPVRPVDTDITISPLDLTLIPRAPDFFHESIASPGQIEISFAPARSSDRDFRLEFFDRYLEWDREKLSGSDDPATPRTIIDMTVSQEASSSGGVSRSPVLRSLESVGSASGFILEGMKVAILQSGQPFSLSSGRALYTGNSRPILRYTTTSDAVEKDISLERFTRYIFADSLSGTVMSGKAYILTPSGSQKLSYSDDIIGMPLLPETRITDTSGIVRIYDPLTTETVSVLPNTEYRHISLGKISTSYDVTFPYPNGFYSARLHSLADGREIRAGVTLLAPQAGLDRSSPVVDIPTPLRVPVYQTLTLSKDDIITDMSPYTLAIDPDVTIDSDRNGVFDDDFVIGGSGITMTPIAIAFGPYDALGIRRMTMKVVDTFGNTTTEPLDIEVYAPIPQIQSVSSTGLLRGNTDPGISAEPIDIFRIRAGEGINLISPVSALTMTGGVFSLSGITRSTGITLISPLGSIPISEKTGLPLSTSSLVEKLIPATATAPMQIVLADTAGIPLFRYDIIPPPSLRITTEDTPSTDPSLLIIPSSGYRTISAGLSDPSIPGGIYIVGADTKAVGAIDIHGQIYRLDPTIDLIPGEKNGLLTIRMRKSGTPIVSLVYTVDFFLTSK